MKNEAVVFFDMTLVPEEIRSMVHIDCWGDLIFRRKSLSSHVKEIIGEREHMTLFHVRNADELDRLIEHLTFTTYHHYYFINSSFAIINREKFDVFLDKVRYIDDHFAIYSKDEICSFLRIRGEDMISLLTLLRTEPDKLRYYLALQFDNKLERLRLETFYIDITGYLDFVNFLQSSFGLRYFNSIERQEEVIVKSSRDKAKMEKEYTFYHLLPARMKTYFLPTSDFRTKDELASYSVERLNVPDLAIQWIHNSINADEFRVLLERLFGFLSSRDQQVGDSEAMKAHARDLYLTKVMERYAQLKTTRVFPRLNQLIASSTSFASLDALYEKYKMIFEKVSVSRSFGKTMALSHGDFCFSNILYDKRINLLKLIDPKGCLKVEDAYIDSVYDVAKLSHSILGHYDFINNGLFDLSLDGSLKLRLEIRNHADQKKHRDAFRNFLESKDWDYRVVRMCELSLFLSMVPLHIDNEKHVLGFLLNAIQIMEELE